MRAQRRGGAAAAICAALCLGLATPVVHAAPEDPVALRVEKLAAEANAAYRAADYQRAVELLERAYQMRQVGALLYNLAKAYEKLGDQDKAIELYHRYSDSTEADPKLKGKAEARVAAYEETHKPKRDPDPAAPPHVPVTEPKQTIVTQPVDPQALLREKQAHEYAEWKAHRRRDRVIGLSLGSVGVASALAGVGLWVAANQLHTTYEGAISGAESTKRSERDRARTESIIGDSLWGVAAVTAAVGAYFLWRGYHPERGPQVTASAIVTPTMTALTVGGSF